MTGQTHSPQMIPFESCLSFRDLGGYTTAGGGKVRSGRLFRSMTPEFMTPSDVARARDELGVALVFDLRNAPDRSSGSIGEAPSRRQLLPFVEMADFDHLRELPPEEALPLHLDLSAGAFVQAVTTLAEAGSEAALFHCQTGKDRTGVLAAMLLRLLDVSEADVMTDYLAGVPLTQAVIDLLAASGRPMSSNAPRHAKEPSKPEGMRAFLDRLEGEFGGARAYMQSRGASQETIGRFVAALTE